MKERFPVKLRPDVQQIVGPIVQHFRGRGVTPEAVLWPNAEDLPYRFEALLSAIDWAAYSAKRPLRLLDVGCGPGFMLDYLASQSLLNVVDYTGVDLSPEILAEARRRWPDERFLEADIRNQPFPPRAFDHVVLCGVFTVRFGLGYEDMLKLTIETVKAAWETSEQGIAFNVMSKHVDWERDDLFHLPCDDVLEIALKHLGTRHVRILHDYGLYEYACIVSRNPLRQKPLPSDWFARSPKRRGD